VLLLGKRDTCDLRTANVSEIERETSPPAADIQYALIRENEKLGSEMPPLRELSIIKGLMLVLEIRAAVLPIAVEKERVKLRIKIIVVGHVAQRSRGEIELTQSPVAKPCQGTQACPPRGAAFARLTLQYRKHVGDAALFEHQVAVHVSLAKSKLGIEQNSALGRSGFKANCDGHARPVSKGKGRTRCGRNPDIPDADHFFPNPPKQTVHRAVHRPAAEPSLDAIGLGKPEN
jgi:hypothetical protein